MPTLTIEAHRLQAQAGVVTQPGLQASLQVVELTCTQLLLQYALAQALEGLRGVPGAGLLTGHGDDLAAPELRLGPLLAQPQPAPDGSQYQAGREQPLLRPGHHRQRAHLAGTLEQAGQCIERCQRTGPVAAQRDLLQLRPRLPWYLAQCIRPGQPVLLPVFGQPFVQIHAGCALPLPGTARLGRRQQL
ncbi:hypothetical protein D3C75_973050 [compost metagenome]